MSAVSAAFSSSRRSTRSMNDFKCSFAKPLLAIVVPTGRSRARTLAHPIVRVQPAKARSGREGVEEFRLAIRGEIDRAPLTFAARPFEIVDALEERRAQRAGQMLAPHAPVKATLAQWTSRLRDLREIDAELSHEFLTALGERNIALVDCDAAG